MKFFLILPVLIALLSHAQATPVRDLQHALGLDDSKWQLQKETDKKISWNTDEGVNIVLQILTGPKAKLVESDDLTKVHDAYRADARTAKGDLVQADVVKAGGILFHLVTMKFPLGSFHNPPDEKGGFAYQRAAFIPTADGYYALQVSAMERGVTGTRETTCFVIHLKDTNKDFKNLHKEDYEAATKSFYKDPYDPAYSEGAKYNLADDPKYDKDFPAHPLSLCRAQMDALLKTWTPEKIIGAARDTEKTRRIRRPGRTRETGMVTGVPKGNSLTGPS